MLRTSLSMLALAGLAGAALAQTHHDSNAPLNFGASSMQLDDKQHRVLLAGSVVLRQAELTLNAARVTIAYSGQVVGGQSPQATRVDAAGGVLVQRPDQTARAQYGVYDLNRRVITMLGGVSLTQKGSTVNGSRLVINLDTGQANLDGGGVPAKSSGGPGAVTTSTGGRVTGTFSVPKRNGQ